jgi:SAM-dependent methyltransferase
MSTAANLRTPASFTREADSWELRLLCPRCKTSMGRVPEQASVLERPLVCRACSFHLREQEGIWCALLPERANYFQRFMREYQIVRTAEGRGSDSDDYYLALPYRDLSGHNQSQWTIRARTFQYFERQILPPLETSQRNRLTILDLGAGNGWMSYRLALRGHKVCAVDLLNNENDGLAAAVHYSQELPELFPRFQAELDCLPFEDSQFDLAVFNASFHYSENYVQTLGEAVRCVRPGGSIVIADTAWYRREECGQQMIAERRNAFTYKYGFPSNALQSQEYLTDQLLASLAAEFGIRWQVHSPSYGVRWALRPWIAKLKGKREPSRFRIYVAEVGK